jgi:hypothetical protein
LTSGTANLSSLCKEKEKRDKLLIEFKFTINALFTKRAFIKVKKKAKNKLASIISFF